MTGYNVFNPPEYEIYETAEKIVGEFLGNVLYESTLSGSIPTVSSTNAGTYFLKTNLSNIVLVSANGWLKNSSSGNHNTLPYVNVDAGYHQRWCYFAGSSSLVFLGYPTSVNYAGYLFEVTIRYYKV